MINSPSPNPGSVGQIPHSDALSEVSETEGSLAEAISRFDSRIQAGHTSGPEAQRDLEVILRKVREAREAWAKADALRPARGVTSPKVPLGRKIAAKAGDLGI
jgi:hypothetical protein